MLFLELARDRILLNLKRNSAIIASLRLLRQAKKSNRRDAMSAELLIIHLADWMRGKYLGPKDPVLLPKLPESGLIIVGFDGRSMAMHAGRLTREGSGHAGVILFRRNVSQMDYGKQSRLLVDFWQKAKDWDWADRIEYLPGP